MLTIFVVLMVWLVLSLPLSMVLGFAFKDDRGVELLAMDGDVAVFRAADGALERVSLADRASH
jgi:hypothetical protein